MFTRIKQKKTREKESPTAIMPLILSYILVPSQYSALLTAHTEHVSQVLLPQSS